MNLQRLCWTVIVLIGVAANLRMLAQAVRRSRRLRRSGRNGALRIIARQGVRREGTSLLVQGLLAAIVLAAWHSREPVFESAQRFYVFCGWILASSSVTLMADSLLDMWDQAVLCREHDKAVAKGDSGGAAAKFD
jgi:hypothetical protein